MKIAFLNLCHCEPQIVHRVANRLTASKEFDMYIHVDAKADEELFRKEIGQNPQVFFIKDRQKVYWGGFNAVKATIALLQEAINSKKSYDYFVLLQNLDYPIKNNEEIEEFFIKNKGKEFIRGCNIAKQKDKHFLKKYKIYNHRDDDFYLKQHSKFRKYLHYIWIALHSIKTISFNGVIKEGKESYDLYYGAAQWAVTRECAQYFIDFYQSHPKFNQRMQQIQFPDEEYFHTIVHNSKFKTHCIAYNEPVKRWLVNWRNIHYFEYPKEITVLTEKDLEKIIKQKDILFIRKVKTGISDQLMNDIDDICLRSKHV